jgi:hypothetical protein
VERAMPLPEILAMFYRVEGRIKAFAKWKGTRTQKWLEAKGFFSGGQLDYHDLISATWLLLILDTERTFATDEELLHYFTGQISGMINNVIRSAPARYLYFSVANTRGPTESPLVISEDNELLTAKDEFAEFERELMLESFEAYLATHAPSLVDLLQLFMEGIEGAAEQAAHLKITITAVYKLREALRRLALEFGRNGGIHE